MITLNTTSLTFALTDQEEFLVKHWRPTSDIDPVSIVVKKLAEDGILTKEHHMTASNRPYIIYILSPIGIRLQETWKRYPRENYKD